MYYYINLSNKYNSNLTEKINMQLKYPDFWNKKNKNNIKSLILLPISLIYILLSHIRRWLILNPIIFQNSKVISIGNITVGGNGKSQLVKYLAKYLTKNNKSFIIIVKGYNSPIYKNGDKYHIITKKSKASYCGDEAMMLSEYGTVIVTKKIKNIIHIINEINPEYILLDDFNQNPTIKKNLNICVFDKLRNLGNNRIFPAGPLRESMHKAINKIDIIIFMGNQGQIYDQQSSEINNIDKIKLLAQKKISHILMQIYLGKKI